MTRIEILMNSVLVDNMSSNFVLSNGYCGSDVQLRQVKDGFWMTSPITGNHFIPSTDGKINDRVTAHWKGFKFNQPVINVFD